MPKDKDFKALVRARMDRTGERYTTARAALVAPDPGADPVLSSAPSWLRDLADPDRYEQAYQSLKALPARVLRPLAVEGSRDPDWRVRRGCCRLLDDLDFTSDSAAALQACALDPDPRVRRAAIHSLTCVHCKPEGCVIDLRPIMEAALQDPNRGVRQMVVGPLTYGPEEPWRLELLRQVADTDPSPKLRGWAAQGLEGFEHRRRSDRDRRQLPDELRIRTERHRGKWVAVSGGRIIDAGGHSSAMARTARKHGHDDVQVYWVAPA